MKKTCKFYYDRPRQVKIFEQRVKENVREMANQAKTFAGREHHRNNQALFKVAWQKGEKVILGDFRQGYKGEKFYRCCEFIC